MKITVLPGDGIGPEVIESAIKVLEKVSERFNFSYKLDYKDFGGVSIDKYGKPLAEDTLASCYDSDAVLLGAVGGYKWENLSHDLKPEAGLLGLRKSLGLFANIRPAKVFNSFLDSSSLKKEVIENTDFVVVRELTGGIYFGTPRKIEKDHGLNTMVYHREEVERITKVAFDIALKRKKKVLSVDKANVLEVSQFWRDTVNSLWSDYPSVELSHMYVDNAAMQIVRDPKQFDVILTGNIFGDILSDISAMITGSLGMLPSASIGEKYALYEPVHGSAPDIAGENKANPTAAILSLAMMFDYSFQMNKVSDVIYKAVESTFEEGYRTLDVYKEGDKLLSTTEFTNEVINKIEDIVNKEAIGVFTL